MAQKKPSAPKRPTIDDYLNRIKTMTGDIDTYYAVARKMSDEAMESDMEQVDPYRFKIEKAYRSLFTEPLTRSKEETADTYFGYYFIMCDGKDEEFLQGVVFDKVAELLA